MLFIQTQSIILEHMLLLLLHFLFLILARLLLFFLRGSVTYERGLSVVMHTRQKESRETSLLPFSSLILMLFTFKNFFSFIHSFIHLMQKGLHAAVSSLIRGGMDEMYINIEEKSRFLFLTFPSSTTSSSSSSCTRFNEVEILER